MNTCDYDHETRDEIRKLPLGGHGNILCCRRHYELEIAFRRVRAHETGADVWQFPAWGDLDVYAGEEISA